MTRTFTFAVLLAALLTLFFLVGNIARADAHTVSTFPSLVALLPFPLVLLPLARTEFQRAPGASFGDGLRAVEVTVRWAAAFFCVPVMLYSARVFDLGFVLISGAGVFIATWLVGVVVGALCLGIVAKFAPRRV